MKNNYDIYIIVFFLIIITILLIPRIGSKIKIKESFGVKWQPYCYHRCKDPAKGWSQTEGPTTANECIAKEVEYSKNCDGKGAETWWTGDGSTGTTDTDTCWIRMPTGCNSDPGMGSYNGVEYGGQHNALMETDRPDTWFLDPDYGRVALSKENCDARLAAFNGWCNKTDAESCWGKNPKDCNIQMGIEEPQQVAEPAPSEPSPIQAPASPIPVPPAPAASPGQPGPPGPPGAQGCPGYMNKNKNKNKKKKNRNRIIYIKLGNNRINNIDNRSEYRSILKHNTTRSNWDKSGGYAPSCSSGCQKGKNCRMGDCDIER